MEIFTIHPLVRLVGFAANSSRKGYRTWVLEHLVGDMWVKDSSVALPNSCDKEVALSRLR